MHHCSHVPTYPHALQLSMPKTKQELNINALYKLGIHAVATIPRPITSNLWILTSVTKSYPAGITLICPNKASKSIEVEKPIMFFIYQQHVVQYLDISIYHFATKIIM